MHGSSTPAGDPRAERRAIARALVPSVRRFAENASSMPGVWLLVSSLSLIGSAMADVSSVDVFVHGEHPLCACIRIPSLVATSTTLVAFAECRTWSGDGCDPLPQPQTAVQEPVGGVEAVSTRIVMKTSTDGGVRWSPLSFLVNASSQPTSVWDAQREILFFMFQNHLDDDTAYLMKNNGGDARSWTAPRSAISRKQERNGRPLFPGPGNAIVLSATHATHPGRLVFPVWLGPDGPHTSASLFFSDDGGSTFRQTVTTWPKDGNDESTVVEQTSGELIYLTRSSYGDSEHHLGVALSTDGGTSFSLLGSRSELNGPPDDVSVIALERPAPFAKNYFAWRPEKTTPCGGSGPEPRRWDATISNASKLLPGGTINRTARVAWRHLSVTSASNGAVGLWIEGGGSIPAGCHGAASYSNLECGCQNGTYVSTCLDLLPLLPGTSTLRYGDAVLVRAASAKFLNPVDGRFTASVGNASSAWTLVSVVDSNATQPFVGDAFALRPGVTHLPYAPPPPPTRGNKKTLYLSHSENLNFDSRTNGTVRASTDGGTTWPWKFRVTIGVSGSVFSRQAFGYSCLSQLPARSPFGAKADAIGMLWESSTPDCVGDDASCAIKFSVVPAVPSNDGEDANGWFYRRPQDAH